MSTNFDEPTPGTSRREGAATADVPHDAAVTLRTNARAARTQQMLERMSIAARIGAWELDFSTGEVICTEQLVRMLGGGSDGITSCEQFLGHFRDSSRERIETGFQAGLKGDAFSLEVVARDSAGETLWCRVIGEPVMGDGGVCGMVGSLQDVTRERSLQNQADQSERDARQAIGRLAACRKALEEQLIVSVTDANGYITHVNDHFCEKSGYSRSELVGNTHAVLSSGHHSRPYFANMWRVISSGKSWRAEMCNKAKDGSLFWVDTTIVPVLGHDGVPESYLAMRMDVSARRELELARQSGPVFLTDVADIARVGGWKFDDIAGFCHVTSETRNILELDDEFVPTDESFGELFPEPERSQLIDACCSCLQTGVSFVMEIRTRTAADREIWVGISGRKLSSNGSHSYVLGSIQDITARKAADIQLAAVSDQLAGFFNISMDPLCIASLDGHFNKINPAFEHLLGYPSGWLEGRDFLGMVHPDDLSSTNQAMAALGDGSVVINFINRYLCRDGSYKSLEWRARPSNGVIYAVARDITDRLAHERELNTRRIEAEAANVAKSQFLATISHEVRTPLNAVIGMLELLLRGDLDPTELERATIALDAARGLLSLLNDVLDLSRLDVGKLNIEPAACDAAKLVRDVAALWMTTAEQKGLELALSVSDAVPGRVAIDPLRVRQVITNLVSNALKFTQRGGVTIMLDHTFAEGCGRLVVEVSDTGIGIADADMPKLFSRFSQVDGSLARRHEGVGLGLAVCRQLVELMGGEISVTSAPGRGSSFRFWVPASQAQEEAGRDNSFDDSVDLLPIRLLRILVAEDHPTNQKLIEALLVSMGHEAVIVANGAEAIAAIQQGEFDLVLMDVQMPVMDGVTAVRAIRKLAPPHSGIPVIALTANAMSGDTEKYLVCGMNDYVAKPIERRLLEEAIDRCSVGLVRTLPAEADRVSGRRLAV